MVRRGLELLLPSPAGQDRWWATRPFAEGYPDDASPWPPLVLIAGGMSPLPAPSDPPPQPTKPGDARVLLRIELPAAKIIVKQGRTVVYEVPPADRPQPPAPQRPADNGNGRPAQAVPPAGTARPDRKPGQFDQAEVKDLVKTLRAGGISVPLKAKPIREPWLVRWPDVAWGVERGPDSLTVWAGAFDYEVLFEVRLSGQGRARPQPGDGE